MMKLRPALLMVCTDADVMHAWLNKSVYDNKQIVIRTLAVN